MLINHSSHWKLFVVAGLLLYSSSHADEKLRPKDLSAFPDSTTTPQKHYRVKGASVAWVNYDRVRADFPDVSKMSNPQIDHWILENFAYISQSQLELREIRSSNFEIEAGTRTFHHPPQYLRASIAEATHDGAKSGLVDLKGTGFGLVSRYDGTTKQKAAYGVAMMIANPAERQKVLDELRTAGHSDGLMSLGEAFAEISRQQAVQKSFDIHNRKHGSGFETVENYFAIDLGFEILRNGKETIRASILGRQAHIRMSSEAHQQVKRRFPPEIYTDNHGNMQLSDSGAAVDFGGVTIRETSLRQTFGTPPVDLAEEEPQKANAWKYGHDTAKAYVDKLKHDPNGARDLVHQHIQSMLAPVQDAHTIAMATPYDAETAFLLNALETGGETGAQSALKRLLQKDIEILIKQPKIFEILLESLQQARDNRRSAYSAAMNELLNEAKLADKNNPRAVELRKRLLSTVLDMNAVKPEFRGEVLDSIDPGDPRRFRFTKDLLAGEGELATEIRNRLPMWENGNFGESIRSLHAMENHPLLHPYLAALVRLPGFWENKDALKELRSELSQAYSSYAHSFVGNTLYGPPEIPEASKKTFLLDLIYNGDPKARDMAMGHFLRFPKDTVVKEAPLMVKSSLSEPVKKSFLIQVLRRTLEPSDPSFRTLATLAVEQGWGEDLKKALGEKESGLKIVNELMRPPPLLTRLAGLCRTVFGAANKAQKSPAHLSVPLSY